ncbi:uncharacterized protein N7459_009133 [Penicillium hispanicum]|uniref:uncharacterized protein n=1 Tax=Penicillium hispanicum TaxID=1080232 RepID=UPI0025403C08|nr:uncharacterized protein N7459_009133 [Penicillium hispanicum]KAJ5569703.1 hypothetical protein N7459_009133 [Penicillium hispanicum]
MTSVDGDQRPTLWGVNSVFIVLATLSVIGRAASRMMKRVNFGLDDWAICVALVSREFVIIQHGHGSLFSRCGIGCFTVCGRDVSDIFPAQLSPRHLSLWLLTTIALFPGAQVGLGKHRDAVGEANVAAFQKLLYFFQLFYILGPPTIKLSLLLLYRRIFVTPRFLQLVNGMGLVILIWLIIAFFLALLDCVPIHAFWTGGGKCISFRGFGIGYAVVNITTDFAVWIMPIPMVWNVQLPTGQKIALSLIFILGLFNCAAAFARLMTSMLVLGEYDVTWLDSRAVMWSIIELSTGITCTCLPTMRVVLKTIFTERLGRALGLGSGSGGTSRAKSIHAPWRSNRYSTIESSIATVKASNTSMENSEHLPGVQQGIRVQEEVKVELQPITQAYPTHRN